MKLFPFAAAVAAALAACVSTAPESGPSYFVMRHLQKADGQDPGLTAEGQGCATRLAEALGASGIGAIYVSTTRRARETAAPLAARLGVTPAAYDPRDTPALVARVRAGPGSVLVVGHSNTVPDIVEQLGGTRPAPLADDRYGDLWRVARNGGATTLTRIAGC